MSNNDDVEQHEKAAIVPASIGRPANGVLNRNGFMSAVLEESAASGAGDGEGGGGFHSKAAANDPSGPAPPPGRIAPTALFRQNLADAEQLLSHAAQVGRFPLEAPGTKESLKQWVIDGVLNARVAVENDALTKSIASAFWASFADLSRITSPVTAATLSAPEKRGLGSLDLLVILLVAFLLPLSFFLFINTSVTHQASQLIAEQNSSALNLWSQVQYSKSTANASGQVQGAANSTSRDERGVAAQNQAYGVAAQIPVGVARLTPEQLFAEVVEFSRRSHWLRETAVRLNRLIYEPLRIKEDPIEFVLDDKEQLLEISKTKISVSPLNVPPNIRSLEQIHEAAIEQILMYQPIRNFAQSALKINGIVYGGITTYLLPALYALLGAALFGLRHYSKMVQQRAYFRSSANTARYFIALIAGTVIGLFGSLLPQDVSLPPLVVAFLVGYAVDAFFSRLDNLIARLTGEEAPRPAPAADVPLVGTAKTA